jgi:pyruvate-ferredoxin/flavodoxin oxidoreductase
MSRRALESRLRLSHHALDHDGRVFQAGVANGRHEPVGHAAALRRAGVGAQLASAAEGFASPAGGSPTSRRPGLVLMKEVLYVISGKRLPVVFHVGARA